MDQSNQNQNPLRLRADQPAELPPLPEGVSYETVVEKPQQEGPGKGQPEQGEGEGEGRVAIMVSEALTEEGEPVVLLWVRGGPQISLKPEAAAGIGMLLITSAEDALSDAAHLSQLKNGSGTSGLPEDRVKSHLEGARNLREQWRAQGWRGWEFEND